MERGEEEHRRGKQAERSLEGNIKAREPLNFLCIMILLVRSLTVDK